MQTPHQRGFFDLANRYEALSQQGDLLEQLVQVISWEVFRPTLAKVLRCSNADTRGPSPL